MARSMVSLLTLAFNALSMARRRRLLAAGSAPERAATVISRISLVKSWPRLASWLFLRNWMLAHLLCPAMMVRFPHEVLSLS
jgi:hypothetical protein